MKTLLNGKLKAKVENELIALVDSYGELVTKRKELEAKEAELKSRLGELTSNEAGKYSGNMYELSINKSTETVYDVNKVAKMLKKDEFLQVVKITSKVKEFIPPARLGEVSETVEGSVRYTVKIKK